MIFHLVCRTKDRAVKGMALHERWHLGALYALHFFLKLRTWLLFCFVFKSVRHTKLYF